MSKQDFWPVDVKLSADKLARGHNCYVCSKATFEKLTNTFCSMYSLEKKQASTAMMRANMSDEELDVLNAMLDTPDPIDAGFQRGGF
jgi:hypothetical protein